MIPHISEYFNRFIPNRSNIPDGVWRDSKALIIGKGTSFQKLLDRANCSDYFSVSINETAIYVNSDINFFIDVECIDRVVTTIQPVLQNLFIPVRPHLNHAPTEHIKAKTYLNTLSTWFNVYSFDLARPTGMDIDNPRLESSEYPDHKPLMAISNSFEAVFHMLCQYGFKEIHSIGVDGGTEYHPLFQTKEKPCSKNPNLTQFETVNKFAQKYGVKYVKL